MLERIRELRSIDHIEAWLRAPDPLMIRSLANQEAGNENVGLTEARLFVR